MKKYGKVLIAIALMFIGFAVNANVDSSRCYTKLSGLNETPPILPIVSSNGGIFTAWFDRSRTILNYTLSYSGLTSTPNVAHIHFGHPNATGAVVTFLCGGGGKPACPTNGVTLAGTIVAADVLAVPAQGVQAGDFEDLKKIIRSGKAYVNVHTTTYPSGEIRGQLDKNYC